MECIELKEGNKELLLLVPELAMDRIMNCYIKPLKNVPEEAFLIMKLALEEKRTPVSVKKQFITEEVVPLVQEHSIKRILVTDGEYFKTLTGKPKVDVFLGYEVPCKFCECSVMYLPNFFRIFYQPDIQDKIDFVLKMLDALYEGTYQEPGKDIIHSARYITEARDMGEALVDLLKYPMLTADIETYSLKHNDAGIASIAFAWDEHNGTAFKIDFGKNAYDMPKRLLLKKFFQAYNGTLIWHNISFDAYILIYQLWMQNQNDMKGLLDGLEVMTRSFEDTKLIAYLAKNACTKDIKYGLKDLSQQFAGNYAHEEINDASRIPAEELLKYNLTDVLSTWYVYNKYLPKMIEDNQDDTYRNIFKPAIKDIIQMQLTGLPIDLNRVAEVKEELLKDRNQALKKISSSSLVQSYEQFLNEVWVQEKNKTLKTKQVTLADAHEKFNPRSGKQKADLLFRFCGLTPVNYTDTNQPSTDGESLTDLFNTSDDPEVKSLLKGLLELTEVDKILSAFIPAFEKAVPGSDGWHYLCGNFNLGGTVSGRLSSNNPNLQNLPATGTKYAKLIKSCFKTTKDKLFIGLDFASLEDRISALTTKDSNKLRVYTEAYDGHCLRAYSYFKEYMPDIILADGSEYCYKANVGGSDIYWKASDEILYKDKKYSGEEFYELVTNQRL